MEELDLKIKEAMKEDDKKSEETKLKITRGAFELTKLYAKLVSEIAGSGIECYGYLLTPKNSLDNLITKVYFANSQIASSAYVQVTGEGVHQASFEIEPSGYQIVGWWHSHGSMQPFHSYTDEQNFRTVLHSIAPRTMYKNKKVDFEINKEEKKMIFDNYEISNVDAEKLQPAIMKKEDQDPFAFSLVVNQFGDYYKEWISKTYDETTKTFKINPPVRPKFEIVNVENDIEFLVADIEWEIHDKIIFNHYEPSSNWEWLTKKFSWIRKSPYHNTVSKFVDAAKAYLITDGKYASDIIKFLTEENGSKSCISTNHKKRKGIKNVNKEKVLENILKKLDDVDCNTYHNPNEVLNIVEYKAMLSLQFMTEFSKKSNAKGQNKIIEDYNKNADELTECFSIAENAMKALTKYSMESFTDYKNFRKHKYKTFITNIAHKLDSKKYHLVLNEIKAENAQPKHEEKLFLFPSRYNIVNQITHYLYTHKNEKNLEHQRLREFLDIFGQAYYKKEENIDNLIEEYLFGIKNVNKKNYSKFEDKKMTKSKPKKHMKKDKVTNYYKWR